MFEVAMFEGGFPAVVSCDTNVSMVAVVRPHTSDPFLCYAVLMDELGDVGVVHVWEDSIFVQVPAGSAPLLVPLCDSFQVALMEMCQADTSLAALPEFDVDKAQVWTGRVPLAPYTG